MGQNESASRVRELTNAEIEIVSGGYGKAIGGAMMGAVTGYEFAKSARASRGQTAYFTVLGAGLGAASGSSS